MAKLKTEEGREIAVFQKMVKRIERCERRSRINCLLLLGLGALVAAGTTFHLAGGCRRYRRR